MSPPLKCGIDKTTCWGGGIDKTTCRGGTISVRQSGQLEWEFNHRSIQPAWNKCMHSGSTRIVSPSLNSHKHTAQIPSLHSLVYLKIGIKWAGGGLLLVGGLWIFGLIWIPCLCCSFCCCCCCCVLAFCMRLWLQQQLLTRHWYVATIMTPAKTPIRPMISGPNSNLRCGGPPPSIMGGGDVGRWRRGILGMLNWGSLLGDLWGWGMLSCAMLTKQRLLDD